MASPPMPSQAQPGCPPVGKPQKQQRSWRAMIRPSLTTWQQALPDQALPYDSARMPLLTGEALGKAIRSALAKKSMTQRQLAAHFKVTPQSVQDWLNRGVIGKGKLFPLLDLFRDVVEPEHWGLVEYPPEMAALRLAAAEPEAMYESSADVRSALRTLHASAVRAPAAVRAELRDLTNLYWQNPQRYATLIDDVGDLLLGETASSGQISHR